MIYNNTVVGVRWKEIEKKMSVVDRLIQHCEKKLSLWLALVFLLSVAVSVQAVRIDPDVQFVVGNETYTVNQTMEFSSITIDSSYIVFNDTGFYVTSDLDVDITLVHINDDITGTSNGERVLDFYASTTGGNVWFNISGFVVGRSYMVNRSGSSIATPTANSSGFISFCSDVWSTHRFEIFQLNSNRAPAVNNPSPSDLSTGVSISTSSLSVTIEDLDGDSIDWTITTTPGVGNSSNSGDSNGSKSCSVSGLSYSTIYTWLVSATDGSSWTNESYSFTTEAAPTGGEGSSGGSGSTGGSGDSQNNAGQNNPPETPNKPLGPIFIEMDTEYIYSSSTYDVDGDQIRYRFDWDDGNISGWTDFVDSNISVSMMHHWSSISTYMIKVQAQDNNSMNSSWSKPLNVTVSQTEQGEEATVVEINVPSDISANQTITFDASGSFNPNGVIISYEWDFGDGEIGTGMNTNHIYNIPGEYTVILTVTDNEGNTYSKSIIVTVSSEVEEFGLGAVKREFPLTIVLVIIGITISLVVSLIIVFRDKIELMLLKRLDGKITKLKAKQKK